MGDKKKDKEAGYDDDHYGYDNDLYGFGPFGIGGYGGYGGRHGYGLGPYARLLGFGGNRYGGYGQRGYRNYGYPFSSLGLFGGHGEICQTRNALGLPYAMNSQLRT